MTSSPEGDRLASSRRVYVDWARGVAVLIMIHAHVLDAWTRPTERSTVPFGYLNLIAGFAAPLFLWLAGVSAVLAAESAVARGLSRSRSSQLVAKRGLQLFVLAFLFRAQAFIVSPGNPLVSLLRVDILNIMGPAMFCAACLWRVGQRPTTRLVLLAAVAVGVAMITPLARAAGWVSALPEPLQWYITPKGNHSTFTLFPWTGFVFAGAACGAFVSGVLRSGERRRLVWLGIGGIAVALASYALSLRPSIYALSSFWTTSPTYFGLRTGLLMLALSVLHGLTPVASRVPWVFGILARFGRHSLFVYWIHVELVYGYATAWVHHRLPLWVTGVTYIGFVVAMYWSIALRDRVVAWWRARPEPNSPQPSGVGPIL